MVNDGITGKTYGVKIDMIENTVVVANQVLTTNPREAYIFNLAYRMGRDHKKMQIREALGI
jgi:hypothetical protein